MVTDDDEDVDEGLVLTPLTSIKLLRGSSTQFLKYYQFQFHRIQELCVTIYDSSLEAEPLFQYLKERTATTITQNQPTAVNDTSRGLLHLSVGRNDEENELMFPFIPNLVSLKLGSMSNRSLPSQYSTLQKLTLLNCSIEDVSALGNIYDLTLYQCESITDISSLQNNHFIRILYCHEIKDYAKSFQNSVIIDLTVDSLSQQIEITPLQPQSFWKNSESLRLDGLLSESFPLQLPTSLRHFSLQQQLSENPSNVSLTGVEMIKQLIIRFVTSIDRLELFGSISILELREISNLRSLDGLGIGNRKVTIERCPLITDFSPLRFVEIVEIVQCDGFHDLSHIDHVHHLKLQFGEGGCGFDDWNVLRGHVKHLTLILPSFKKISLRGSEEIPIIELMLNLDLTGLTVPAEMLEDEKQKLHYANEKVNEEKRKAEEAILFTVLQALLDVHNHQKIVFQLPKSLEPPVILPVNASYHQTILYKRNIVIYIRK